MRATTNLRGGAEVTFWKLGLQLVAELNGSHLRGKEIPQSTTN